MTDKQPQTLSKQTVFVPIPDHEVTITDTLFVVNTRPDPTMYVKQVDSVYVLTEQEMNNVKREAAEKAYDACLESIHNNPTTDVEVSKQNYLNTNYPL